MGRLKKVARTLVDGAVTSVKDQPSHLKVDPNAHPKGTKEYLYAKDLIKSRHSIIILSMNEKGEVFTAIQTSYRPLQEALQPSSFQMGDMKYNIFAIFKLNFLLNSIPNDDNSMGNLSYEMRKEKLQAIKDFAVIHEKPIKIYYHDVDLYQFKTSKKYEIDVLTADYIKEIQMFESDFNTDNSKFQNHFRKSIYVNKKMSDIVDDELSENLLDCGPCRVEILTKLSELNLPDVVFEAMHEELLDNNLENTKFKGDGDYLEKQDNFAENFVKETSLIDEFECMDMLIGDKE